MPIKETNFDDLYTEYYKISVNFVKSYIHDTMAAEDIATDSLIKVWQQIKAEKIEPIAPYLYKILKNSSLDYLKHELVKNGAFVQISQNLQRDIEIRSLSLEASDPKEIFSEEIQRIFLETLNKLPIKSKEIFILNRFEMKSHKKIAKIYGITTKGVEYHIYQTVKKLRISLKDYLPILGMWLYW